MSGIDTHINLTSDVNKLVTSSKYYISTGNGYEVNLPAQEMYGMLYVLKCSDIIAQLILDVTHAYFRCWISYRDVPNFKIIV